MGGDGGFGQSAEMRLPSTAAPGAAASSAGSVGPSPFGFCSVNVTGTSSAAAARIRRAAARFTSAIPSIAGASRA
jgi:hypothetical protein